MEIGIVFNGRVINPNDALPKDAIFGAEEERDYILSYGFFEKPAGKSVLIKGTSYIINNRRYDLTPDYGIKATLTSDAIVVLELRKSVGKEVGVIKTNTGIGICDAWPIIEKIQPVSVVPVDFVKEALAAINEAKEVTDTFEKPTTEEPEEE